MAIKIFPGAQLWGFQMLRGAWAILLGISLLFPFGTRVKILMFISLFWISGGIMSLIWGVKISKLGGYWWLVAGIVGVLGGSFVFLRTIVEDFVKPETVLQLLALLFFFNGLLHVFDAHRSPEDIPRHTMSKSPKRFTFVLGLIEILIAIMLAFFWGQSGWVDFTLNVLAISWSLIGGLSLLIRGYKLKVIWDNNNKILEANYE